MGLKKRIGCGILAIALSLPLTFPVDSYAGYFSDIKGHWAEFHIRKVYSEKIISGYPDGRFWPDKAVTRAEFAAMVNKTFALDRIERYNSINFKDVNYASWYYNAVSTAVAVGYAGGYNDDTFKPDSPISRQEAMVMLSRLLPSVKKSGNLKIFSDYRSIASWATEAMAKMNGKGYIGAYSDKLLHPADALTRAQTAKILSGILDNEDIITRRIIIADDKAEFANKVYVNNVIIDEGLEDGSVTIDNCIILGTLKIEGGGEKTVTLNNTRVVSAIVDRDDGKVRVVTKGDTIVSKLEAFKSCYLQASSKSGYGFPDITVNKMADVTLKGTFPKVSIEGSRANITLESGKITNLSVTGAGKYSDITLSGKAEISEATVNAESYFHGSGTIGYMTVNAGNVTYETKPNKMLVGLNYDKPEAEGKEEISVSFKPKHKEDDVDVDTTITITFNSSMTMADGDEIRDSDISSIISLRKGSDSGEKVLFKGKINSAKKIITITPNAKLSGSMRYYVILEDKVLKNAGGNKNDDKSIYFFTEETDEDENTNPTTPAITTPVIANLTLTPANNSITMTCTPNMAGTIYALVTTSASAPSEAQIIAGQSTAAAANTASSLTVTGLNPNTRYYIYTLLRSTANVNSAVVSSNTATTMPYAVLQSLTVSAPGGTNLLSGFQPATKSYTITMPTGTTSAAITASADTTANPNAVITINGTASDLVGDIPLNAASDTVIRVRISADNRNPSEYVITVR
ncbi:MAG: S-layer homology domain-containing protein [Eubacteriales bacterium]|nr:S-layer homology domain-containing protein [Eubacteriales bacterium]